MKTNLITNKFTEFDVHYLISFKGREQFFNPNQNFLKYDIQNIGISEQNNVVSGGPYFCYECNAEHLRSNKDRLFNLIRLFNLLDGKES